ncbi:MAG: glutamate racemase [Eubacteriales bacterium]|nr:glutamate racemase [Eubacteriales bacterium]
MSAPSHVPASRPIGVFDSGLGGLTVLQAIQERLPAENTVYFGDTGRTPYGTKSPETIIKYSQQISRFLLEQNVKMIVIACNTASATAFEAVRDAVDVPVIEVITPGAEAAATATQNDHIGIIGTRGTVNSGVYVRAVRKAIGKRLALAACCLNNPHQDATKVQILQQACPLFVGLAEEGWWDHPITQAVATEYLKPLQDAHVDTLILGCTHYPLLAKSIADVMGPEVKLINAGNNVATEVEAVLQKNGLLNLSNNHATHAYFTSDDAAQFQQLGSAFLNRPVQAAGRVDIERY